MDYDKVNELVKSYPDFPKKGILFHDVHPIMMNPEARKWVTKHLVSKYKDYKIDVVAGLDSRGYYFGVPVADELNLPFLAVRKAGKLPGKCKKLSYGLEYGNDALEIQEGVIKPGSRVLITDDLMATGGTAKAAVDLIQSMGAVVVEVQVIIELTDLNGKAKLPEGVPLYSLFQRTDA